MQFSVGACRMGVFFAKIVCGITDNRRYRNDGEMINR